MLHKPQGQYTGSTNCPIKADVSVIVVNWNGRHLLESCLASLAAQTLSPLEVILVDNGSEDGSADWVASHHPEVRLVRLDRNYGFCGGNNAGIRVAKGEYFALLNNDAEAEPRWLERLRATMREHAGLGACDSKVYFYEPRDLIWASGADYSVAGSVVQRGYLQPDGGSNGAGPAEVFVAVACAVMYRRSALDHVGLFDEDFFSGYEDVDLSFRLQAAGYGIVTVPDAIVYHKVSATSRRNSEFYVYYGQRNVLETYLKNMPAALLLKYLPLHVLYTLGSMLYFARLGRLGATARGKLAVLRSLDRTLAKRRAVQRLRTAPTASLERKMSASWLQPKYAKLRG